MKKIILFSLVLILIVCAAVPVMAAETYTYVFDSTEIYDVPIPSVGNYRFSISFSSGFTFSGVSSVNIIVDEDLIGYILPISSVIDVDGESGVLNFRIGWFELDGISVAVHDFDLSAGQVMNLTLEKIESPGFVESINSGLDCVMSWIQSLISALISGSLSPILLILAVGIAVSALFLGAKYIYMICWGC